MGLVSSPDLALQVLLLACNGQEGKVVKKQSANGVGHESEVDPLSSLLHFASAPLIG